MWPTSSATARPRSRRRSTSTPSTGPAWPRCGGSTRRFHPASIRQTRPKHPEHAGPARTPALTNRYVANTVEHHENGKQSHNPKVAGSNPAPATNASPRDRERSGGFAFVEAAGSMVPLPAFSPCSCGWLTLKRFAGRPAVSFTVVSVRPRQELDLQLEELRQLAARRGWAVISEYTDVISGTSTRPPGLGRLLADPHAPRIDVVAVWKLDRLGRSLVHLVQVIDELLGKGIHLVFAVERHMDSPTPQGRLLPNIFASVAEYERELIRERVRVGQARARAKGVRFGRRPRLV